MANVYVRSGAAGAGTGADWTNAYTTLAAAFTAKAAGDTFWIADDHAETQASAMTLTAPGTKTAPNFVRCVNRAGSVPPVAADLATTGTITTTGGNAITCTGHIDWYGVILSSGSGANSVAINMANAANNVQRFDNCAIRVGGTSGGLINLGTANPSACYLYNTTIQVAAVGSAVSSRKLVWKNTASAVTGATIPTTLFSAQTPWNHFIEGVDLSALGSGKTLVGSGSVNGRIVLKDCQRHASVTVAATPGDFSAPDIIVIRTDSAGTSYVAETYSYAGTETSEITIVRTGGASDGTTQVAKKIVTTANARWGLPFEAIPITIWNDSTSAITLTLYGVWGGGAVPNNDDIWMAVEYLGASGSPLGSFATAGKASAIATNAALSSDSSTWGGSTTKFKMSATFTPGMKGPITIYVRAAAASSTFYIDPKPEISGVTVSKSFQLAPDAYVNEISSGGGGSTGGYVIGG